MDKQIENIIWKIQTSKIYKVLDKSLIRSIVEDCHNKYGSKDLEKRAKNLLHQIWGAYYVSRPNFQKIYANFIKDISDGLEVTDSLKKPLLLHSSTKERIPILDNFYKDIFGITGTPNTIIDHACGLNPLTFPWMNLASTSRYLAYDIDNEEIEFLNRVFKLLGKDNFHTETRSIFENENFEADIIFMFKLIPVLEQQHKNSTIEILEKQKCKFLIVSFPIKSIGGKEKGMKDFYSIQFEKLIEGIFKIKHTILFQTELVYILERV